MNVVARRLLAKAAVALTVAGGVLGCGRVQPVTAAPPSKAVRLEKVAMELAPVRIMPLGDSITYGLGSERLGSYRVELARRLRAANVDFDFVGSERSGPGDGDNEGHSGWRIDKVAGHVREWMAADRPDVVLLHIGTNDMRSDTKADGAAGRLAELIDRLTGASPTVEVLVAEIAGAKDDSIGGVYQRRIDAYNAAIPAIVSARGDRVRLVDQTGVDGTDLLDMLHPNEYGYRKMAWAWYQALEPLLNSGDEAWPTTGDPSRVTMKYLREHTSGGDVGRWWRLRWVAAKDGGRTAWERRWTAD